VRPPERLVVRAPNWLGDVVLSLAALRDLRRNFPDARLTVLARASVSPLYEAVPEVDGVALSRGLRPDAETVRGRHDAAVLFTNSFGSALSMALGRVPERWGYASDGRGALLTRRAPLPPEIRQRSQVYYYRAVLSGVGLQVSASSDTSLRALPEWTARGETLLGSGRWIGLNPGASYGSAKQWLPARFAAVGDRLAQQTGARVAILGSAAERPLGETIAALMRSTPRVLSGATSLTDLVGVLSRLGLLVTNDSGPMHLAAALDVPLVAIFGPTDWRVTAPRAPRQRLLRAEVDCAPCLLRTCPIDHRCMSRVGIDAVVSAASELWQ
jgi:lipopolysaccharide heptosyltransferase II